MANPNPSPETRFDGSTAGPGRTPGSISLKGTARRLAQQGDRDRVEAIVNNLFNIAENTDNLPAAVSAVKELKEWFDGKEANRIEVIADEELVGAALDFASDYVKEKTGEDVKSDILAKWKEITG